jgi:ATP-binding cassette subfamily B (MDR/TAP) protein 1
LFNGSVYDNIVTGLIGTAWEDASIEEKKRRAEDAAKLAFAHDFITELAQGYDTTIGQRGGLLSGGQKQRIAIARSIISDPQILLLDEATSALDPQAEHIVQQALDNASKNRTTITIAHKLATIRGADSIVVMSHGRISEQGTHEHLSTSGGLYEKLVRAQDLAPSSNTESSTASDDDTSDTEAAIPVSLTKTPTREARALQALRHREDFDRYKPLGLIRSIAKLISMTPELAVWYFVTILTCIAGGKFTFDGNSSVPSDC